MKNISNKLLVLNFFLSSISFAKQHPDMVSAIVINDPGIRVGILSPLAQAITNQLATRQHQPDNRGRSRDSKFFSANLDSIFFNAHIESSPDLKSMAAQLNQESGAKALRRQIDSATLREYRGMTLKNLRKENKILKKLAEELKTKSNDLFDHTAKQIVEFLTNAEKSDRIALSKKFISEMDNGLDNLMPLHFDDPQLTEISQFLDRKYGFSERYDDLRKQYKDIVTKQNKLHKQIDALDQSI